MTPPPAKPKIYHITHVENFAAILEAGGLLSDADMIERGGPTKSIGMGDIKRRRLELPVKCHAGDRVGEYVPFYFCPRSVMLYLISKQNHPNLAYQGGQGPIVHLEADFAEAVDWAESERRRWAFTLSNAGAAYTEFRDHPKALREVDWEAVHATDWRNQEIRDGKQAEFLVRGFFPWELVRRIGVQSTVIHSRVVRALADADHRPAVEVQREWYY